MPRKESADSASITKAKSRVATVIRVGSTIGATWRSTIRSELAPMTRAADDEHALADLQHLGARRAQIDRDAGDREHQDQVRDPRLEHVEHHDREQQRGEAHDHVGRAA